jgi:hypothetical protein
MALNKANLQNGIETLLTDLYQTTNTSAEAHQEFASRLANLIDNYIKDATITIPAGFLVVVGSATTQQNPAPILINNGVS